MKALEQQSSISTTTYDLKLVKKKEKNNKTNTKKPRPLTHSQLDSFFLLLHSLVVRYAEQEKDLIYLALTH